MRYVSLGARGLKMLSVLVADVSEGCSVLIFRVEPQSNKRQLQHQRSCVAFHNTCESSERECVGAGYL